MDLRPLGSSLIPRCPSWSIEEKRIKRRAGRQCIVGGRPQVKPEGAHRDIEGQGQKGIKKKKYKTAHQGPKKSESKRGWLIQKKSKEGRRREGVAEVKVEGKKISTGMPKEGSASTAIQWGRKLKPKTGENQKYSSCGRKIHGGTKGVKEKRSPPPKRGVKKIWTSSDGLKMDAETQQGSGLRTGVWQPQTQKREGEERMRGR